MTGGEGHHVADQEGAQVPGDLRGAGVQSRPPPLQEGGPRPPGDPAHVRELHLDQAVRRGVRAVRLPRDQGCAQLAFCQNHIHSKVS